MTLCDIVLYHHIPRCDVTKGHVTFGLTPMHVSFGDIVANPPTHPLPKVSRIIWMSPNGDFSIEFDQNMELGRNSQNYKRQIYNFFCNFEILLQRNYSSIMGRIAWLLVWLTSIFKNICFKDFFLVLKISRFKDLKLWKF